MNLVARIRSWFSRLLGRDFWMIEACEEAPEAPAARRVYLIGELDDPWAAAFLCPCDCGELIQLSLMRDDDPSWIACGAAGGRASLHPSIWRIRGCRSHFFIKDGRVVWAKEARPDRTFAI